MTAGSLQLLPALPGDRGAGGGPGDGGDLFGLALLAAGRGRRPVRRMRSVGHGDVALSCRRSSPTPSRNCQTRQAVDHYVTHQTQWSREYFPIGSVFYTVVHANLVVVLTAGMALWLADAVTTSTLLLDGVGFLDASIAPLAEPMRWGDDVGVVLGGAAWLLTAHRSG